MGSPPQDRSRRTRRRTLDHTGAANLEPPNSGRGLPRTEPSDAERQRRDALNIGYRAFPRRGSLRLGDATVGGPIPLAKSVASGFTSPAVAGPCRGPEEPNPQPGGRALHRVCSRLHAAGGGNAASLKAIVRGSSSQGLRTSCPQLAQFGSLPHRPAARRSAVSRFDNALLNCKSRRRVRDAHQPHAPTPPRSAPGPGRARGTRRTGAGPSPAVSLLRAFTSPWRRRVRDRPRPRRRASCRR